MPLHKIDHRNGAVVTAATYASEWTSRLLPKLRMPESSVDAAAAYELVHDELLLDGNSRQNLATFCTT